jgi:hypothetical protein
MIKTSRPDNENQKRQNDAFDHDSHKTARDIAEEHGGQIPGSMPQNEASLDNQMPVAI